MTMATRRVPAKTLTPQRIKPKSELRLTPEQVRIREAARTGDDLIIQAGAGSGKSSTLREIALDLAGKSFLYVVYNTAAREDAEKKSPKNMHCRTRHSLAYGAIGWKYRDRNRKGRMTSSALARRLKIIKSEEYPGLLEPHVFKPAKLASLALETVSVFCSSDAEMILPEHVPYQKGLSRAAQRDLSSKVATYAGRFWLETIRPKSDLWFADDYYFKLWLMSKPTLPYDVVMLDEAQDSTRAVRQLILSQHTQKIAVGDSAQSLYRWQGAVNIMDDWPGKELFLTMSFRFGDAIAEEANLWLEHTGTKLRIKGNPAVTSRVGITTDDVDAVLCRSNGMCIQQAVDALEQGLTVGFSKDPSPLKRLAWAAKELQEDGHTDHEDFSGFSSWDEVVEYSDSPEGSDMKVFVKLVNRYSARRLGAILMNVKDARHTPVERVVATAHSTKGLEWPRVRIAEDFKAPDFEAGEKLQVDDAMVAYVAVTRAKTYLDHKGLEWIHTMPSDSPQPGPIPQSV
jgi:superfamily I DNA/RNA helicase